MSPSRLQSRQLLSLVVLLLLTSCGDQSDPRSAGTVSFDSSVLPQAILDLGTDNLDVEGEIQDSDGAILQAAKVMTLDDDGHYTLESTVAAGAHVFAVTIFYNPNQSALIATFQTELNISFNGKIMLGAIGEEDIDVNEENLAEAEQNEST